MRNIKEYICDACGKKMNTINLLKTESKGHIDKTNIIPSSLYIDKDRNYIKSKSLRIELCSICYNQILFKITEEFTKINNDNTNLTINPLERFLIEKCQFDEYYNDGIESIKLYNFYKNWCKETGFMIKPNTHFGNTISKIYGKIKRQKRIAGERHNIYLGLQYIENKTVIS